VFYRCIHLNTVRFEVFTVEMLNTQVFWNMMLCCFKSRFQCFE